MPCGRLASGSRPAHRAGVLFEREEAEVSIIAANAIADLIDRIPALRALPPRGIERIEAEEAIRNAIDDAIEAYREDGDHP